LFPVLTVCFFPIFQTFLPRPTITKMNCNCKYWNTNTKQQHTTKKNNNNNRQCAACYGINHLGPEGYHWRVFVEDKHPVPGDGSTSTNTNTSFSWWDIQDENASLPVKEARQSQLHKFFGTDAYNNSNNDSDTSTTDDYTKTAKGALKTFGKAVTNVVVGTHHGSGGAHDDPNSTPVKVIAFKLLDLVKIHDDFSSKNRHKSLEQQQQQTQQTPSATQRRSNSNSNSRTPVQQQQQQQHSRQSSNGSSTGYSAPTPIPPRQQQQQRTSAPSSAPSNHRQQPSQSSGAAEPSLMDFGPTTIGGSSSSFGSNKAPANETRAQKLKREYAQKNATSNRVWDEIDERWIEKEVPPVVQQSLSSTSVVSGGGRNQSTSSMLSGMSGSSSSFDNNGEKKKEIGISLSTANAVGKSATVQRAVHARVNEMQQSQAKALEEVRDRETKKKQDEIEEDTIRKQLEPKIKVWSEEHGKKKQLRALLASLHTILWPGAQWKQVTIGDLLDSKKVKVQFHKASRVVHPDKTHHLHAEQRFLAKRIFDALSQAKNEFDDNGGK
jgi:hypothetical protein